MKATYVKTKLQSVINISKIVTIHYYEVDKHFTFKGERHDFWEMVYVDKGSVQVRRDEEEIVLHQGEVLFHEPNEFHSIKALNSSPNFFVVSFVCDSSAMRYLQKYCVPLDKKLQPFISSIIKEAERTFVLPKNNPQLKRLVKKETAPIGGEQLIKTYLEQLLIILVRGIMKKGESAIFPSKESMQTHLVLAAKEYFKENLGNTVRISDVCNELGYSKTYLSKLFHEQSGETMASYAMRLKIEQAKLLIREGNMSFSQISDSLAFDNPQYFSRVFKRITGMSPSEFKRSLDL